LDAQQNNHNQYVAKPIQTPVMKSFSTKPSLRKNTSLIVGTLAVIVAGVATGWFLSGQSFAETGEEKMTETSRGVEVSDTEAGFEDESAFSEEQSPEGVLEEGGIEGEGTHHLDRGLGEDKYVYLTSTVIDLQSFVGKKVKVWGETLSGIQAGWLMDVGKIKVIN
jgi:hypothetical protein